MKVIRKAKTKKLSNSHKKTKSKQLGGGSKYKNTRVARLRLSQRGGASPTPRRNNNKKRLNGESDEEYVARQLRGYSSLGFSRAYLFNYNLNIILPNSTIVTDNDNIEYNKMLVQLFDKNLIEAIKRIGIARTKQIAESISPPPLPDDLPPPLPPRRQPPRLPDDLPPPRLTNRNVSGAAAAAAQEEPLREPGAIKRGLIRLGQFFARRGAESASASPIKSFTHYWYNTWPDHGVPTNIEQFKTFINMLKHQIESDRTGANTIIHCSAGVGRTGTVFVCLYLLMVKTGGEWTVRNEKEIVDAITYARNFRMLQVQTPVQYNFICNCFGITEPSLINDYKQIHPKLHAVGPSVKDRYQNILPYKKKYITLANGTYINASPANIGRYNFILTQCPIENTIADFHNMIWEKNVSRIVMLTGLNEGSVSKCNDYLDLDLDSDLGNPFTLYGYDFNKLSTLQHEGFQERNYQMTQTQTHSSNA
jgi:protein tyrosine phosphatase